MDVFSSAGLLTIGLPFIVNFLKKLPFIGNRFAPLLAFILGAGAGIGAFLTGNLPESMNLIQAIMAGVAVGGTSTGLYDVAKKTVT